MGGRGGDRNQGGIQGVDDRDLSRNTWKRCRYGSGDARKKVTRIQSVMQHGCGWEAGAADGQIGGRIRGGEYRDLTGCRRLGIGGTGYGNGGSRRRGKLARQGEEVGLHRIDADAADVRSADAEEVIAGGAAGHGSRDSRITQIRRACHWVYDQPTRAYQKWPDMGVRRRLQARGEVAVD